MGQRQEEKEEERVKGMRGGSGRLEDVHAGGWVGSQSVTWLADQDKLCGEKGDAESF